MIQPSQRFVELAAGEQMHGQVGVGVGRQRIELERPADLAPGLFVPAEQLEQGPMTAPCRRVVLVERERPRVLGLGASPVPVEEVHQVCERGVRLAALGIELQSLARRGLGLGESHRRVGVEVPFERVDVGERRERGRERGIDLERLIEARFTAAQTLVGHLIHLVAALEIELVGLRRDGARFRQPLALAGGHREARRRRHLPGELGLERQHLARRPLEIPAPHQRLGIGA